MVRTVLAAAMVIGLVACGGGTEQSARSRSTAKSSQPAASASKGTDKTAQKKKTSGKPDTTRAKNPLTNN
jgi:hypothetical protein